MYGPGTHAAPIIVGKSNLLVRDVLNAEELSVGDSVIILTLPNNKFYLDKNDKASSVLIEEITLSHILFAGLELEVADVRQN